jgi:hypothetical protein
MTQNSVFQKFQEFPDLVDLYSSFMSSSERKIIEPHYTLPKPCTRCKQIEPTSDFYDENHSWCKDCDKQYNRHRQCR